MSLSTRPRLHLAAQPPAIYAIGDVHGRMDLLAALEQQIVADAAEIEGEKVIVMLGDYVDRGPASAQVIEHLLAVPPAGFARYCLAGNHEQALLAFLHGERGWGDWLSFGGWDTLASYGYARRMPAFWAADALVDDIDAVLPTAHLDFLAGLFGLIETPRQIFVHAGLRVGVPIDAQGDQDLLWIRDDFRDDYAAFGKTVVHGHTPRTRPLVTAARIAIDTGAYFSDRLTAVRLVEGEAPRLLQTGGS